MEWYTSLPHAHRVELSDRGRISDPAISYDPSRAPPAHHEAHGISFVAGDGHGHARRGAAEIGRASCREKGGPPGAAERANAQRTAAQRRWSRGDGDRPT